MASLRKLASQTLVYGVSSIIGRVINAALTPFYTRYFAPAQFGIFSDLYAQIFYPFTLLTFGLETAFFRFSRDKVSSERAYSNSFLTVALFTTIFLLFTAPIADKISTWLGYAGQPRLILILLGIIACDVLAALPMARMRYEAKPQRFATITLLNIVITILLNLFFIAYLHKGIEFAFVANLIASAIKLLMALQGNLPRSWRLQNSTLGPMLHYGVYIMLAGLLWNINENLDKFLLPRYWVDGTLYRGKPRLGIEMNGIYNASYKIGVFITLVTQAFRYAAEPFFFQTAGEKRSPETFARVFHYFILCCLVVFLLVSTFSFELVSFTFFGLRKVPIFPPAYWVGLEVVPVVLLANICFAAYITLSIWFKISGQIRFGLLFSFIGSVITVAINLLFIRQFGYMACAWAHLVCYGVMAWLCYRLGQNYYPVPYAMQRIFAYCVGYIVVYVLLQTLTTPLAAGPRWLVKLLGCAAVLLVTFWLEHSRPLFGIPLRMRPASAS